MRSLAASIEEVGLLHPIVVTPQGRPIAGRRLKACLLLGWAEVPVTVVDLLQASPAASAREFCTQGPAAQRDRGAQTGHRALGAPRGPAAPGPAGGPLSSRHSGGRTGGCPRQNRPLPGREAVLEAAEENPEEYGHLVEQMERSGKVSGAYHRLTVFHGGSATTPERGRSEAPAAQPPVPWPALRPYDTGGSLPYPTMDIEDIKALPVREIADGNSILWLWTANTHLRVAFDVVEAWGFEYKRC